MRNSLQSWEQKQSAFIIAISIVPIHNVSLLWFVVVQYVLQVYIMVLLSLDTAIFMLYIICVFICSLHVTQNSRM